MDIRFELVRHLADGRFHSGEELAAAFGITRAAVWKQLQRLSDSLDLEIQAVRGRGYRLSYPLELLEEKLIYETLSPQARSRLGGLEIHDEIDSTNSWLMEQAAADFPTGSACFAERQTAGRGRRGRKWVSPFGSNIYLSLLWRYPLAPADLGCLSLAAGMAVVECLAGLGVNEIGLKWPNDILYQGRKLAGLLLEISGESEGPCRAVVGVGINTGLLERDGQAIDQPWVGLEEIPGGETITRNRLAAKVLEQLLTTLDRFERRDRNGFSEKWRCYDLYYNQPVLLRMGDREMQGVNRGVDREGALILESDTGRQSFHAGEVSLRRL